MSGIFGIIWSDRERPAEQPLLERMASAFRLPTPAPHKIAIHSNAGYGVLLHPQRNNTNFSSVDIHESSQGLLAWDGEDYNRPPNQQMSEAERIATPGISRMRERLQQFNGPFALAAFDNANKTALIATDRMGIRPLVYAITDDALIFASRIAPVIASGLVSTDMDPQALFEYFYSEKIPSPMTFFKSVRKLPPGHCLELDTSNGKLSEHTWWDLQYKDDDQLNLKDAGHEIFAGIESSVGRCANYDTSGEPTNCFLSGGLDSSTVTGMVNKVTGTPARTFSIGFHEKQWDERHYSRLASKHFSTDHHERVLVASDALDVWTDVACAFDEPFGNSSIIPTYHCAKFAHDQGADMMLAGDGGDEVFGGNNSYRVNEYYRLYRKLPSFLRNGIISPFVNQFPESPLFSVFNKARRFSNRSKTRLPEQFLDRYFFDYNEMFEPGIGEAIDYRQPIEDGRRLWESLGDIGDLNKWLYYDLKHIISDGDLHKVTTMCDLAGVRVRYPLLDPEVLAIAERLPRKLKTNHFALRPAFKQSIKDFLPTEIINKKKHGFSVPTLEWMRSDEKTRNFVREVLTDPSSKRRGIINQNFVENIIDLNERGLTAYAYKFTYMLTVLELWMSNVHDEHIIPSTNT